jgi:hypothetical protein
VQLFKGSLHFRCELPTDAEATSATAAALLEHGRALKGGRGGGGGQMGQDQSVHYCAQSEVGDASVCGHGQWGSCADLRSADGLNHPVYSLFDTCSIAAMSTLGVVTFDDWTEPMHALMVSVSPASWIYFVTIVVLGGFFMVNLFLAVLYDEFSHTMQSGLNMRARQLRARPPVGAATQEAAAFGAGAAKHPIGQQLERMLKPVVRHPGLSDDHLPQPAGDVPQV